MLQSMPSITSKFQIDYYYVLKTISINSEIYTKSLLNTEQNKSIISEMKILNDYKSELVKLNINFNIIENDLESIVKEYELETKQNEYIDMKVLLPKNLQKELKTLKTKNNRELYNQYIDIQNMENLIKITENKIQNMSSYCDYMKEQLIKILLENNYIIKLSQNSQLNNNSKLNYNLDIHGLAVININECNGILLIEMIKNNIFDNLETTQDIICILSIFASYSGENSSKFNKYYGNIYKQIESIKEKYNNDEQKYGVTINKDFWETTDGYVDITYEWANGADMGVILGYLHDMNEYEGNFVKNMLKIYNICINFKKMCELLNKNDIIMKMEDLDKRMLRDIVNVNSLYLC
jgi:superfamily II RNA helicase